MVIIEGRRFLGGGLRFLFPVAGIAVAVPIAVVVVVVIAVALVLLLVGLGGVVVLAVGSFASHPVGLGFQSGQVVCRNAWTSQQQQ